MSGHHGLRAFTETLAAENEHLFITYRGKRLWFDWHLAHEFAFFSSMVSRRKESVHGVFVAGRWYWHVRVVPAALTDDGGSLPGVLPAPSSPTRCVYWPVAP